MEYPDFFDKVEKIILKDDLSDFLGVFRNGIVEISYLDIVKSAGHSCPTVAGAYLMTLFGLKALYGTEIPVRGGVKAEFSGPETEGVTGVIANVVENITGATAVRGFKGIGGHFVRHSLMYFNAAIAADLRLTRIDNGLGADIYYNPDKIPGDPRMKELMPVVLQGRSSVKEKELFGTLWQERVADIINNATEVISVHMLK